MSPTYPVIKLTPGHAKRARAGHPWVFSNEIAMDAAAKALPRGSLVVVEDAGGEKLGVAIFNPNSLIAARFLTRDPKAVIDAPFIIARLKKALALRETLYPRPFYRLIHAEADGMPGLVIDRYGDVIAIQANAAGMDLLLPQIVEALESVIAPKTILLKNESASRTLEGLELYERVVKGSLDGAVELEENGARFLADLAEGQKTGWFFDQRDNRAQVAALSKGRTVLDFYAYAGGFAVQAALAGAKRVIAVDRSETALDLAQRSAGLNGVIIETARAEAFAEMERLAAANARFGMVVADPPAFVKSKKDLEAGAKGYRKMTRLAAALVEPDGFLFVASCSHHIEPVRFAEEVRHGLANANRSGRILRALSAAPDHPVHPALPESAYLKALLLQLD
ncbi:MAG TPA: class I SAM-dependent rRNA methyltransferase [Magnetospirillaceae bacterium]|jgi:23S rRNA (cytosine1962-C5)-methyltransferase